MKEAFKKLGCMIRRDHLSKTSIVTCAMFLAGAGVAGLVTGALLPWSMAGLIFSGVLAGAFVACEERSMRRMKDADMGYWHQGGIGYFMHLQGPGRSVAVVVKTQKLLERALKKYARETAVPPEAMKRLEPYVRDAQEAGRAVKAVVPNTPIELPTFEFVRTYFNAAGGKEKEMIAAIDLPHAPPPWELEKLRREAEERQRAADELLQRKLRLETEERHQRIVDDILQGTSGAVTVRALRLKPKSALSQ